MCRRTLTALLLLGLLPLHIAAKVRFHLASISDHQAQIALELPPQSCEETLPWLIAFSTLPGKAYTATLNCGESYSRQLSSNGAGWAGTDYLQWCAISPRDVPCVDSTIHAVITIGFTEPLYRGISIDRASFRNRILRVPLSRSLAKRRSTLPATSFSSGVRMEIDRDGICMIETSKLRELGIPIERIRSRTYRLFQKGREIPIHLSNAHHETLEDNDHILFYCEALRLSADTLEQYSQTNVYWLTWGTSIGARVAVVSGGRRVDPTVYTVSEGITARPCQDTAHIEEDNTIIWFGNVADRPPEEVTATPGGIEESFDNWYWSIIGTSALTTLTFNLPSPVMRGVARMKISFMGQSSIDSITDDHRIDVFINEKPASSFNNARWDGQRPFIFESDTFSSANLRHGENRLTLKTSQLFTDRSALNWIEISYPRGYDALDDRALFRSAAENSGSTTEYSIEGFSTDELELWDITRHRLFTGTIIERGSADKRDEWTLTFQDSVGSPTSYLAQSIDQRVVPVLMTLDTIRSGWDTLTGIDYIVISTDSFATDIRPLLDAHRENGLRTAFVAIDDIYAAFSYGIRDPESIRRFLQYLFNRSPNTALRYLLLGGDTSHDLDKKNRQRNIVPTRLSRINGWGPAADDGYFASVNDDDLFADLAIGRFPARNREEMRRLVDKTVRYIREPCRGYWRDNLLMLGGGESIFTRFNDNAASDVICSSMRILRMDADPQSRFYKDGFIAPQRIADHLNSGVYMVNFNGHGGGNIWSDNDFFGYNNLSLLHNGQWGNGGRLPVVFSFTCLTGFFESTEYRSLGEEFVRNGDDGAIAFYGASAYTSRDGNIIMNRLLLEKALDGTAQRLGDLVSDIEIEMLARYRSQHLHLVRQYNLLGDPALPWQTTPDTLDLSVSLADSTRLLSVSGSCLPVSSGQVRMSLLSGDDSWNQTVVPAENGLFSGSFPLKEGMTSTLATIRAYAWNDSAEVRGWIPFVKDTLLLDDVRIDPPLPSFGDSVMISCRLFQPTDSQGQLYCLYGLGTEDDQITYTGIGMVADTQGRWSSGKRVALPFSGSINDRLRLYFRAVVNDRSLQSRIFSFAVAGRPDLAFTDKAAGITWQRDSLCIEAGVINIGNSAAPPFVAAIVWRDDTKIGDTAALVSFSDSLQPGKRWNFSVSLPDTQGELPFRVILNPGRTFAEILDDNNQFDGRTRIYYRDLSSLRDTLSIRDGYVRIVPFAKPQRKWRLFVLEDTIQEPKPLATPSAWLSPAGAPAMQWRAAGRAWKPADDSLTWIWSRHATVSKKASDTAYGRSGFMLLDTAIGQWRFISNTENSDTRNPGALSMSSSSIGPFAIASIGDKTEPEVMVSVQGKSLDRPDYTAKDRPFTMFFADPSGILPQSIALFLNGNPIPSSSHSAIPVQEDLRSLSISIYPQAERKMDSLEAHCCDLAGNTTKRIFAYLPGSDLLIRSFSCHPNPFTAKRHADGTISKIRFAFVLTDLASSVTLSIYTVSGKKIRTWSLDEVIGYHQVEWDGRDRDGFRIANGTYYAKLIAKNDRKKVKKFLRIAKLEGF